MPKQELTLEELLKKAPQLRKAKDWLGDVHKIVGEDKKEILVTISPTLKEGYPKLSIKENEEWIEKSYFVEKIMDGDNLKVKCERLKKRYQYSKKEDETKKIYSLQLSPIFSSQKDKHSTNAVIIITFPENYSSPKQIPFLSEIKAKEKTKVEMIQFRGDKNLSFLLDSEFLKDSKPISANRVAGLDEEKKRLKKFLKAEIEEKWGLKAERGIILEGPPGTGKTELTIEVCQEEFGKIPVLISGPEILSKWVGETERILRKKFHEAWERERGRVVYIDELDAIARAREKASQSYSAQIVSQLLVLLDGVEAKQQEPFKVVASTNLAHVVDPALRRPGRLGERSIRFEIPDRATRKAILHFYLQKIWKKDPSKLSNPLKRFVRTGEESPEIVELLNETVDFTGADLEDLIRVTVKEFFEEVEKPVLKAEKLKEKMKKFEKSAYGSGSEVLEVSPSGNREIEEKLKERTEKEHSCVVRIPNKLNTKKPKEIAKAYFRIHNQEEEKRYRWRELKLSSILGSDPIQTRENIINAFQHSKEEQISLYFPDFEYLQATRQQSQVLKRIWGLIHELFLGWDPGNLLIIRTSKSNIFPGEVEISE